MEARESHKSADAVLKEVRRRFHAASSKPEGLAAPSILRAVLRINSPSIFFENDKMRLSDQYVWRDDGFGDCCGGVSSSDRFHDRKPA